VQLIPRDNQFYDLFSQLAQRLTGAATLLHEIFKEPQRLAQNVARIKELEHQADDLTHEVIDRIDRTFVTPFDREDIHTLAKELDEVIDLIDGTARRVEIFRLTRSREKGIVLSDVLLRAANCTEAAVKAMRDPKAVSRGAMQLKELEEEGDAVYHDAMGALFSEGLDPIEVIKWKELYDKLEDALDQCEDVGNVLQSISLKNA
jgi:predicted phosphate transport protein (TIGR00153 family)